MEFSNVIQLRRSIRKFKDEAVSDDVIRELLEAARLAPSGSNLQPSRFVVARSTGAKEALGRFTPYKFIVKAAVVFVCCADLTVMATRERRVEELFKGGAFEGVEFDIAGLPGSGTQRGDEEIKAYLSMNVAIAVEHIVLKAVDLGLGSCWVGRFDRDQVRDYLALSESIHPVVLLPVGHPDQSPKARPRVSLEKLVLKTI